MKNILILLAVVSCSSYVHTPQSKMISPEAQGKFFAGSLEGRTAGVKQDKLSFENNDTSKPISGNTTVNKTGGMLDLGLLKRLDLTYADAIFASAIGIVGLKYQILGSPRNEAKKGNFSTSIFAGYGHDKQDLKDSDSFFNWGSNIDRIKYEISHEELGLIVGYRWSDRILHYVNAYYFHQDLDGHVTTDDNVLTNASFKDSQNGMLYSTGLSYDLGTAWFLKLDYSHMTSKWSSFRGSTANSLNAGIGAYW